MKSYRRFVKSMLFVVITMLFLQGCGFNIKQDLYDAVANVEEIHRLCTISRVDPKDVPTLCLDAQQMAGRLYSNNKVLKAAIEDACAYATERQNSGVVSHIANGYKTIQGSKEIYRLAGIRLGVLSAEKGNLYRLTTGDLPDWERANIQNNRESFIDGIVAVVAEIVIVGLILFAIVKKISHSFWIHI